MWYTRLVYATVGVGSVLICTFFVAQTRVGGGLPVGCFPSLPRHLHVKPKVGAAIKSWAMLLNPLSFLHQVPCGCVPETFRLDGFGPGGIDLKPETLTIDEPRGTRRIRQHLNTEQAPLDPTAGPRGLHAPAH